MLFNYREMTAE